MMEALQRHDDMLADPQSKRSDQPEYATNAHRSIRPELGVMIGLCTHLGCIPTYRPKPATADFGASWPGGLFCPCRGSKFDLAERVFRNVPAPTNLVIPPHRYVVGGTSLLIGADTDARLERLRRS
jgi:ubiquinol-cytochrome c reductase iron-sulfur subunit